MDSVEETRRELFESGINIRTRTRNEHGDYVLGEIRDMWSGFNLALDSVEIELPPLKNSTSYYGGGDVHDSAINHCRYNIESLNLGIKIK